MKRLLRFASPEIGITYLNSNYYELRINDNLVKVLPASFNQLSEDRIVEAYFKDSFILFSYNDGAVLEYRNEDIIFFNSYIPGLTPTFYLHKDGAIYAGPFKVYNRVSNLLMTLSVDDLKIENCGRVEELGKPHLLTRAMATVGKIWKAQVYRTRMERVLTSATTHLTKSITSRIIYDTLVEEKSPIRIQKDLETLLCLSLPNSTY